MTIYCFSLVLESLWVGLGHPRIVAIASGLAMVCTLSLGLILIPRIAEAGAAIAFAAGSAVQLAVIGSFTAWCCILGRRCVPSTFLTETFWSHSAGDES